ncbi:MULTISPECIES: STAS domain-containing protein [unclassified Streptomyces]|uniref:STAS domain-containing protein n=1 Tax=unclassified Streptomyces TaxID=2593676 RepID=UPI00036F410F|nr:STAS domain-containing protein [Streptomyces sp. BoleA5]
MTESGPCLVARVHGTMDYVSQPELLGRLTQVIDRAERAVVLNLAGVSFCDSAGLNVLLGPP